MNKVHNRPAKYFTKLYHEWQCFKNTIKTLYKTIEIVSGITNWQWRKDREQNGSLINKNMLRNINL